MMRLIMLAVGVTALSIGFPARAESIEEIQQRIHKRSVALYAQMAASKRTGMCDEDVSDIRAQSETLRSAASDLAAAAGELDDALQGYDQSEVANARSEMERAGHSVRTAYEALPYCSGAASVDQLMMYHSLDIATEEVLKDVLGEKR